MADLLGRVGQEATKIVVLLPCFNSLTSVIQIYSPIFNIFPVAERSSHEVVGAQHVDLEVHEGGHHWLPPCHPGQRCQGFLLLSVHKACVKHCVSKHSQMKVSEVEFNQDFIARVIPKIDWDCLCRAAEQLGHLEDLPKVNKGLAMH